MLPRHHGLTGDLIADACYLIFHRDSTGTWFPVAAVPLAAGFIAYRALRRPCEGLEDETDPDTCLVSFYSGAPEWAECGGIRRERWESSPRLESDPPSPVRRSAFQAAFRGPDADAWVRAHLG